MHLNILSVIGQDDYEVQSNVPGDYTWEDTVTVNVLTEHMKDDTDQFVEVKVQPHYVTKPSDTRVPDISKFDIKKDGVYHIYHIVTVTKSWLDKYDAAEEAPLLSNLHNNGLYYFDQQKGQFFFRDFQNEDIPVSKENFAKTFFEELGQEVAPEQSQFSASYDVDTAMSIYQLRLCYVNLCQQIFDRMGCSKCHTTSLDDLIFKRDMIYMAISVINYCIDLKHYHEAARHLEWIHVCGGLCHDNHPNNCGGHETKGCGCAR